VLARRRSISYAIFLKDQSIADQSTGRTVLHELAQLGSYELVERNLLSLRSIGVFSDNEDVSGATPESIARALAENARRPGDYFFQRRSRYLRIAELIHSFSRELAIGNWRKRTNHGLKPDNGYKTYASRRRL
jgi:hypothetical protein